MHMKRGLFLVLASLAFVSVSNAGPFSDDLSKCLVESTTAADKSALVKWIFAMASLHPEVKATSSLTDEQRTALSKGTAALFTDLVTKRCKEKTLAALKHEGPSTLEASFNLLGQAAMVELIANPEVAKGLAELANYFDEDQFEAAFGQQKASDR